MRKVSEKDFGKHIRWARDNTANNVYILSQRLYS